MEMFSHCPISAFIKFFGKLKYRRRSQTDANKAYNFSNK